MRLTRDEIVTLAAALAEFRDEYAGPHHDANRAFAERLNELLRTSADDEFFVSGVGDYLTLVIEVPFMRFMSEDDVASYVGERIVIHHDPVSWRIVEAEIVRSKTRAAPRLRLRCEGSIAIG